MAIKSVPIQTPEPPNFIRAGSNDRGKEGFMYPVEDFTDDELKQIGSEWTEKLIEKAQRRRKAVEDWNKK